MLKGLQDVSLRREETRAGRNQERSFWAGLQVKGGERRAGRKESLEGKGKRQKEGIPQPEESGGEGLTRAISGPHGTPQEDNDYHGHQKDHRLGAKIHITRQDAPHSGNKFGKHGITLT